MPEIASHLATCAACREWVAGLEGWLEAAADSMAAGMPDAAASLSRHLHREGAVAARIIPLIPMTIEAPTYSAYLAADGEPDRLPEGSLEHRATLYAEDPELVLRIMRNPDTREESLHLISGDPGLSRNVLVHVVEPSLDFVTDAHGIARLGAEQLDDPASLQWQVRLPEATFTLSPLGTPGTAAEPERETEITAEGGNRIGVALERQAGGVLLRLRLIELGAREELDRVRLVISQGETVRRIVEAPVSEPCTVTGLSLSAPIDIRIFAI